MNNLEDDAYMGDQVVNFEARLMEVSPGEEPSVAFLFLFQSGSTRVVKFVALAAENVSKSIRSSLSSLSVKDDREEVLAHVDDVAYLKNHPEIQDHAFVKFFLVERPNLPEELFKLLAHQYAKIIHVNAYRSFFKFDLTFVDDSTSRISIPISVVWIFVEQLEDALKAMRAMSKPG